MNKIQKTILKKLNDEKPHGLSVFGFEGKLATELGESEMDIQYHRDVLIKNDSIEINGNNEYVLTTNGFEKWTEENED